MGGILAGCNAPVETTEAPTPNSVALTGKPDPALAGSWKTDSGSTYVLDANGSITYKMKVKTPAGERKSESSGRWRIDGNKMLFEDQAGIVVPYGFKQDGNTITLTMPGTAKNEFKIVREAQK